MSLTKDDMEEMSRVFFYFKKQGIHVSFKEVAEVTFLNLEASEDIPILTKVNSGKFRKVMMQ